MGQIIYSGTYPDLYAFSDGRAKASLKNNQGNILPANAVVKDIFHEIYAGINASIRGQSVTASFTLTDAAGNNMTIVSTAIAPMQSPAYIRFGGAPNAANIDYNNLVRVKLGGTDKLVTRQNHECPLYINYHLPLVPYTDPVIIAGETPIKAAHILELQENINSMRLGHILPLFEFAEIRAGYTNLNMWSAHINQLRTAIDQIGVTHEEWLPITENKPRADVIMQLRRVVAAL